MENDKKTEESEEILDLLDIEFDEPEDTSKREKDEPENTDKDVDKSEEENPNIRDDPGNEEQEEQEEQSDEEVPFVKSVAELLGYDGEDEFEDTEEGLSQLVAKAGQQTAEQYFNQVLDNTPHMKEFYEYVNAGGDPQNFLNTQFPETDFSAIEVDENDEVLQERLVKEDLVARGYTGEEIQAEIKDFKNGGILESKAKRALEALKVRQTKAKQSLVEEQKAQQQAELEDTRKYWDTVKNTVMERSTLKGLKVPVNEKQKFIDYISKPVKEGKSQRDLDLEKLEMEDTLAVDWLLYKNFDVNSLVTQRAKDINAKTLRDKLKQAKLNKQKSSGSSSDPNAEIDI